MENPEPDWAGISTYVWEGIRTSVYEDDRYDWEDDSMYMGSDSDFSDHALGIDY